MSITFNDNIYVSAGKPIDSRYLNNGVPYTMAQQPNLALRYVGMTILRSDGNEWWYPTNINTLVIKIGGGGGTSGQTYTSSNGIYQDNFDFQLGGELTKNTLISGSTALQTFDINLTGNSVGTRITLNASGTNGSVALGAGQNKVVVMKADTALTYAADYSSSFSDLSLVNKAWVLANAGGGSVYTSSNGITKTNNDFALGGSVVNDTTLSVDAKNFHITNDVAETGTLKSIKFRSLSLTDDGQFDNFIELLPNYIKINTSRVDGGLNNYNYINIKPDIFEFSLIDTTSNMISTLNIKSNLFSFLIDSNQALSGLELSDSSMTIKDEINYKGLVYDGDYSSNFGDNSLVTKQWVLANAGGGGTGGTYSFANGIYNSAGTVRLSNGEDLITNNIWLTSTKDIKFHTANNTSPSNIEIYANGTGGNLYLLGAGGLQIGTGSSNVSMNTGGPLKYYFQNRPSSWNSDFITDVQYVNSYVSSVVANYQPIDADLTSIAGLAGTTGFLKKTAANTWALDTTLPTSATNGITLSSNFMQLGGTLTSANTQLNGTVNNQAFQISMTGGTGSSTINLTTGGIASYVRLIAGAKQVNLLATSALTYAADYTSSFVDRSLVDKGWVLAQIAGTVYSAGNGLTLATNQFTLGGTLTTANTNITGSVALQTFGVTLSGGSVGTNISFAATGSNGYVGLQGGTKVVQMKSASALTYSSDYSASYTSRSLVDKGYVDALISSPVTASQGLNKQGNDIQLGGTMTHDTLLTTSGFYDFKILNDNGEIGYSKSINIRNIATNGNENYDTFIDLTPIKLTLKSNTLNAGINRYSIVEMDDFEFKATAINTSFNQVNSFIVRPQTVILSIDVDQSISGFEFTESSMVIKDQNGYKGLVYESDYKSNYTDRSLVDKGFVNTLVYGSSASAPTALAARIYFNTTDKHFYGYTGTAWVRLDN